MYPLSIYEENGGKDTKALKSITMLMLIKSTKRKACKIIFEI
jgi:hypothetical protein